jgi:hypothetical protein
MTAVLGKWAGRATAEGADAGMGRWSEVRIIGKDKRAVWAITAYRVCGSQTLETAGAKTAFRQQHRFRYRAGIEHPNPRKQMLHDLATCIGEMKQAGEEVILMMDSNESLDDSQGELTKWVRRLELTDIMAQKHGTEGEPETYNRGTERIDHIFLTQDICEFVTAAGILGYNKLIQSDHRPLYVDMDLAAFLGGEPSPLENGTPRGVMSSDPRAVQLYREQLQKCLDEERLAEQLDKLETTITENGGILDNKRKQELDRLEEKFSELKELSERACAKVKSYPWSPKLRKARNRLRYWHMWHTELKLEVDLEEKRKRLDPHGKILKEANTTKEQEKDANGDTILRDEKWTEEERAKAEAMKLLPPALAMVQKEMRRARKAIKKVLSNAKTLRQDHLEDRANIAAYDGNEDKTMAICKIMRAEEQRNSWARIRRGMGRNSKSGLSHVLVENADGTSNRISEKLQMEAAIISRNIEHFSQADGSPFTTTRLTDVFGRYGTNKAAEMLLDGIFDIEALDTTEAVKEILYRFKRVSDTGTISDHLTSDDLHQLYSRWNEGTSTSPSGLHLGHEKAILRMEATRYHYQKRCSKSKQKS